MGSALKTTRCKKEKPLVILVHDRSLLRLWMEHSLSQLFRVCAFSSPEDALAFVQSIQEFDVLITDLDLEISVIGGCNIVRDVKQRFHESLIFVFSNASISDHRIILLRGTKGIQFITKPFDALFITRTVKKAIESRGAIA
jgi:CheY-like chemotaxis protein